MKVVVVVPGTTPVTVLVMETVFVISGAWETVVLLVLRIVE